MTVAELLKILRGYDLPVALNRNSVFGKLEEAQACFVTLLQVDCRRRANCRVKSETQRHLLKPFNLYLIITSL